MEYLQDFGIQEEFGTKQLKSFKGDYKEYTEMAKAVASLLENSPVPAFVFRRAAAREPGTAGG